MALDNENLYRNRFAAKYNRLFYDAWRISRFNPLEGAFWLRTLNRQRRREARRKRAEANGLVIPPVLIYSITSRCNLRCKGCYASCRLGDDHKELSTERVQGLFSEASQLGVGVIMIAGGEPLMRPEILWAASEHRDMIFPVFKIIFLNIITLLWSGILLVMPLNMTIEAVNRMQDCG